MTSDLNVRAVARAVSILEQFTLARPEATLTEISSGIGLSKSTTHRLLSTLEGAGMVEFDRKTTRYRLGLKLFSMGSVASKSMELVKQADPLLRAITEDTDETSLLLVVDDMEGLCLRRADGDQPVRVLIMEAGKHIPFNCGAAGRVLLAHLPDTQWEEVIIGHTHRATKYSLVSREELDRDRHEIRERGYAVGWEDCALSACSLGAPVRAAGGVVVASVSILGILERFSAERLPTLVRRVMQVGNDLSGKLGYRASEGGAAPR
jgi:IclR family KDG regulon transcriptional repressor